MGRFAQQRKRGGDNGAQPGLPAGPDFSHWSLSLSDGAATVTWLTDDSLPGTFWESRWRVPALSMLWSASADDPQPIGIEQSQTSPFTYHAGQQQDCEVRYRQANGTPLSGWSGYQSLT